MCLQQYYQMSAWVKVLNLIEWLVNSSTEWFISSEIRDISQSIKLCCNDHDLELWKNQHNGKKSLSPTGYLSSLSWSLSDK